MGYVDSQHVFSQSQTLAAVASTLYSTNTFDTAGASASTSPVAGAGQARYLGVGEELFVNFLITAAVTASGGAANVTFFIGTDAQSPLASGFTEHWRSVAIAKGTLVLGYRFSVPLPVDTQITPERYLGTAYAIDTNTTQAGSVTSWLSRAPETSMPIYASGLNFA